MKFLRRFLIRLKNLATGRSADQRLQDEMDEHLAFQTEENLRVGMSPGRSAQPERIFFKSVTPNYFAVLGGNAQLGRTSDPRRWRRCLR